MSESFVGFTSAVTRQKAGRFLNTEGTGRFPGLGGVKLPALTLWAEVIVVSGSLRPLKLSQEAANAGRDPNRMINNASRAVFRCSHALLRKCLQKLMRLLNQI